MTLRIFAVDETQPPLRGMVIELRCDGKSLFCAITKISFTWYPDAASEAIRSGWTLTAERHLGPCCSGKRLA